MPLSAGTRLGPYELASPLGAGGMGEVYRARDTRLGRDVALKILPDEFARDANRRQRFELEARAVAALNHPNIVAVYDVGEGYIISELVDGVPLRGVKPGLRRTIEIGVQIAEGLSAAHAAGITHRDLKPDNILLTKEGRVKILDFGLAKMAARQAAAANDTVTVASEPGVVMGTVGYMSPEQVRGQAVDPRSDIFSLGLILYELLTGQRAFSGDTSVETMTAILKQDAPELPETVPAGVRRVIGHCLEKEPGNRFQSARDLAFALSTVSQTGSHAVAALPTNRWRRTLWAAAALSVIALIAGALWLRPTAPARWIGVRLGGPEFLNYPRLSPDGHLLAFVTLVDEIMQVGVMKLESGDYTVLTHARDKGYASAIAWSPDGSRIYYDRWTDLPRGVYSVPVLGGPEEAVAEDTGSPETLPDGTLLLGRYNAERQYQLMRFWPDSGKYQPYPVELASVQYIAARAFPDGKEAAVFGTPIGPEREKGAHIYALDLASGAMRRLGAEDRGGEAGFGVAVTRDGKSVVRSRIVGNVVVFSALARNSRKETPLPFVLTSSAFGFDTGPDGSIYADQTDRPVELLRFAPGGGRAEKIAALPAYEAPGTPQGGDESFAVLPDGRVVAAIGVAGRTRLVVVEAGKPVARLVNTAEDTSAPVAAVGANEVAFLIGAAPRRTIAVANVANGRVSRRIPFDHGPIVSLAASLDGNTLYCGAGGSIWSIPREGSEPKKIHAGDHVALDASRRALVVQVTASPMTRFVRVPLDGGPEREIHWTGSERPAFSITPNAVGKDGRIVMPLGTSKWYWPAGILDPASGQLTPIPVDRILDYHGLAWAPDGSVIGLGLEFHSAIWKFSPEAK